VSNRYVHVERKAGHTVHDTVANAYAPFETSDDADAAASLLNIFGDVLGYIWLTADKVGEYEANHLGPETDGDPDDTRSPDGDD
jgi:hypothetical protein